MSNSGAADRPETLTQCFFDACERFKTKRAALRHKTTDAWASISHEELSQQVHFAAAGLRQIGVQPGERIGILSHNRPEWAVADFASLSLRCANVPVAVPCRTWVSQPPDVMLLPPIDREK